MVGGGCAACIRFGALSSRQRSFFLYCDVCLGFRGGPVLLDIELSVSARYRKTRVLLRERRLLLLVAAARSSGRQCAAKNSKLHAIRVKRSNGLGAIRIPEYNDFSCPTTAKFPLPKSHPTRSHDPL